MMQGTCHEVGGMFCVDRLYFRAGDFVANIVANTAYESSW